MPIRRRPTEIAQRLQRLQGSRRDRSPGEPTSSLPSWQRSRVLQSSETLTQVYFGRLPRAAIEQNEPSEPKIGRPRPPVPGRSRRLPSACQLLSAAEEQSPGPFLAIRNVAVHGEGSPRSRQ